MRANELRIGNFVNGEVEQEDGSTKLYTVKILAVDSTSSLGEGWDFLLESMTKTEEEIEVYEDLQPIPLTEEWLVRFGFSIKKQKSIHGTDIFYISHCDIDYCFAYAEFRGDYGFYIEYTDSPYEKDKDYQYSVSFGIKHVHTLQNLYFALTGEELKLKNNESKID
jgi:hypothetical protein